MMKITNNMHIILLVSFLISSCGTSFFSSLDKSDAATDATIELENDNPDKAIDIILNELGSGYEAIYDGINDDSALLTVQTELATKLTEIIAAGDVSRPALLVSILASAKAQKHGIDPFTLGLKFADSASSSSSSSSTNNLTLLFPVLPEPTATNLRGLDVAMTVLQSLASLKSSVDQYKEALFLTASMALVTKSLDTDGDGQISALEAISLSDAAAQSILSQISSAVLASAASEGADAENVAASAEQIQALQSAISGEDGSTDEEKLRNYMSKAN